jgi:hypothetical protein
MYTLRKITGSGVEINISLGEGYTFITKERNPNEFKDMMKTLAVDDDCFYGFVTDSKGEVNLLSNHQKAYIMEYGHTIDNVSQR